jgi:hypothetical protein
METFKQAPYHSVPDRETSMKIPWPRRKKTSLLTLFSGDVSWPGESPETELAPPFDPRSISAHPKNAPGGFYIVDTECTACGYPHHVAPELMESDTDSKGRPNHCFFRKQPETALELIHAIKAIEGSCCGAVRYSGNDAETIRKLKAARMQQRY